MKIGIIRGGEENYDDSLTRGSKVILHVLEKMPDYKLYDIFLDKENTWHLNGLPTSPMNVSREVDVAYNVGHPSFGKILENFGGRVVQPSSLAFGLVQNRPLLQNYLKQLGVKMPRTVLLPAYQEDIDGNIDRYTIKKAREVFEKFGAPYIVRALNHSKLVGIHVARTYPELIDSIYDVLSHGESVLVEELIGGKVVSAHTLRDFKGNKIYAMPMPGYKHKEKEDILNLAKKLHEQLDAGPYLKSDFVIHPKRGVFCVNLDLHPNIEEESAFCRNCRDTGLNPNDILKHFFKNN